MLCVEKVLCRLTEQIFLLPFLDILYFCFILFIAFLFLFLRDADSRKGALCPFCVPIHKKKKKKTFASDRLDRLPVPSVLSLVLLSHVDQLAWKQYG